MGRVDFYSIEKGCPMKYKLEGSNRDNFTEEEIDRLYNTLGLDRWNPGKSHISASTSHSQVAEPKISGNKYFGVRTSNTTDFTDGPHSKKGK
jgi:hypothetical protein